MPKPATWRILNRGSVPADARTIPYACACGREAELPVRGMVIAILGDDDGDGAIVFEPGDQDLPDTIQCRRCGRVYGRANAGAAHVR